MNKRQSSQWQKLADGPVDIRERATRRIGELMAEQPKAKGTRGTLAGRVVKQPAREVLSLWTVIMRLANPIGVPTARAFHSGIHVRTSLAS
jgi:hypothetical protein